MIFSLPLRAQIVKELLCLLRDKSARLLLIVPPLLQLLLFAYALTYDVDNVRIVALDQDHGYWSEQTLAAIAQASFVREVRRVDSPEALQHALERRQALLALTFPADFSRRIAGGETATLQVIADGRRANAGQVASAYVQQIVQRIAPRENGLDVDRLLSVRYWFNPALNYKWPVVPGLAGILAFMLALVTSALSIARERELGTFDQLQVSPCSTLEILIAKMTPPFLVGVAMSFFMFAVAVVWFGVPFAGSLGLLMLAMSLFIVAIAGIGLMISALCATQQQAVLGVFGMMVPIVLISGFATPIENMPGWLQLLSQASPFRHYFVVLQGAFLKGMSPADMLANTWPMLPIAAVTFALAWLLLKWRLR